MGPLQFSVKAGGTRSNGFNAIVNPGNFSYNGDKDGYSTQNVGRQRRAALGGGAGGRASRSSATV